MTVWTGTVVVQKRDFVAARVDVLQSERFDILLSDLNLPQPNAGFTVIKAMRKMQPRCINFVLTGYPAD